MTRQILVTKLPEIIVTLKETWHAPNKYFRVFWAIVFLACLTIMTVEMVYLYIDFFKYSTDTKIEMESHRSIKYPFIRFCAIYPMNYNEINAELPNHDDLANYIYSTMFIDGIPTNYTGKQTQTFDQSYAQLMKQDYSFETVHRFFLHFGLHCHDVFKLCSSQNDQFNCCSEDTLIDSFITASGQCFMIRPPNDHDHQTVPGVRGSLRFILGRDNYFGENYTSPSEELTWLIHYVSPDFRTTGESDIDFSPTIVRPGQRTQIHLKPIKYKLLGEPHRPGCADYVMHRPDNTTMPYQVELCYRDCEAAITMRECGCVRLGTIMYLDQHRPICTPEQSMRCAHYAADHMQCECPIACKYIAYNPTKDTSPLERNWAQKIRQVGYKLEHMVTDEQISIIDIHYSVLVQQTMIQEPKWTVTTLFGSIGGQCSLWLGIRIFSVIQLVFYIMLSCCATDHQKDNTDAKISNSLSLIGMSQGGINTTTGDVHEPLKKETQTEPQTFLRCDANCNADTVNCEKVHCNDRGTGTTTVNTDESIVNHS